MSAQQTTDRLTPQIRSLLAALRLRIRAYVILEGIALAIVWLGATFWCGLALDYGPVMLGANEMPLAARTFLLLVIAAVLGVILFRWIARRAFLTFTDRSMAVLLERRFHQLEDSLVTSVELSGRKSEAGRDEEMISHTTDHLQKSVQKVQLSDVFNAGPLVTNLLGAAVMIASIAGFYAVRPDSFEIWSRRIYLLQDDKWPRSAFVELHEIRINRPDLPPAVARLASAVPFEGKRVKVAQGTTLSLWAAAGDMAPLSIPPHCTLAYSTSGKRGRARLTSVGRLQRVPVLDEKIPNRESLPEAQQSCKWQRYKYDGSPFQRVQDTVRFDVIGIDYRAEDYEIEVVSNPVVTETVVKCEFPDYTKMTGADLDFSPGMRVPQGTDVKIHCRTNKPLRQVFVHFPASKEVVTLDIAGDGEAKDEFVFDAGKIVDDINVEFILYDEDRVTGLDTHSVFIDAMPDEAPQVDIRFAGIGSAITQDALLPIEGTVIDDYELDKSWLEFEIHKGDKAEDKITHQLPLNVKVKGEVEETVDLKQQRNDVEDGVVLEPGQRVILTVKAQDTCNINGTGNLGGSDRRELEVVTPDQLRVLLEAREIALRRRFERIIEEMTLARDSVLRVRSELEGTEELLIEPENKDGEAESDEDLKANAAKIRERLAALRLLRVQDAWRQSQKLAQEVNGISVSFLDIRAELVNNRVDSEDRKDKLINLIAKPLAAIATEDFPEFDVRLKALEESLLNTQAKLEDRAALANPVVEQADHLLAAMDNVLQQMMDIETFNELVDIVRAIIEDQKKLSEETRKLRLKSLLLD